MAEQILDDAALLDLLRAVGLTASAGPESFALSFADLDLDSLARMEIATRIQDRYGVDVEEELTAEETPQGLQRLVADRLIAAPNA
jgi:acyl carrier protein